MNTPPIQVTALENSEYCVADGVRRSVASEVLGLESIEAEVIGEGAASTSMSLQTFVATAGQALSSLGMVVYGPGLSAATPGFLAPVNPNQ